MSDSWEDLKNKTAPFQKTTRLVKTPILKPRSEKSVLIQKPPTPKAQILDGRSQRAITRGDIKIEAKLDLHGMTEARAHEALKDFIHRARQKNLRYLLVITGKGTGALRNNLPHWLSAMAPFLQACSPAHARHGGDGAFYVILQRG